MMRSLGGILLVLAGILVPAVVPAAEFADVFADNMVLQQGRPLPVWGKGVPGERVTVRFAGEQVVGVVDARGVWSVTLPALQTCKEGRTLSVNGETVGNVLVGEVWIVAGQSNMVCPLTGSENRFRDAEGALTSQYTRRPLVRLMTVPSMTSSAPAREWPGKSVSWRTIDPDDEDSRRFSAIGWYFGAALYDALDIPVGIIACAWNGSRIEGWIPTSGYELAGFDVGKDVYDAGGYGAPCSIWNGKVSPLAPLAVRGFVWYQGESNCGSGWGERKLGGFRQYGNLLRALYRGWSCEFRNDALKMLVVQLAPWGDEDVWPMQFAQSDFVDSEPNASLVVANDLGVLGDVHGSDKRVVANRLLALALEKCYDFPIRAESPRFNSASSRGSEVVVSLANVKGLYLRNRNDAGLDSRFELAGSNGVFLPAKILNVAVFTNEHGEALLSKGAFDGTEIRLRADGVREPKRVRYLHGQEFGNVYNEVGLPLAAFEAEVCLFPEGMEDRGFLDRRVVVSDTKRFTCGSGSVAAISPDGTRLLVPYLASTNGFGECHDITAVADVPLDRPQAATSHIVCKSGDAFVGTVVTTVVSYASVLLENRVRIMMDVNFEKFGYRDWDPKSRRVVGEGLFMCRAGAEDAEALTPDAISRYLGGKGLSGFDPCRSRSDRCVWQNRPQWIGNAFYGFVTSSRSQPILFRCEDGETLEFLGAIPTICEYECQLAILHGVFYAIMRGAKGDNFWTSDDGGVTWKARGRVPDGLQRPQMLVWKDKVLIGYSAPDEKPSLVRNGRNNLHLIWGEGPDLSAYREILHVVDPIGIVYPDLVDVNGDLHILWSNSERFPTHVKWGAVQGKDQILHAKLSLQGK